MSFLIPSSSRPSYSAASKSSGSIS